MTDELREKIRNLEEQLLQPEVRKDPAQLAELIADDFIEYGSSGKVYRKKDIIRALPVGPVTETEIEEYFARPLSPQVVLFDYMLVSRDKNAAEASRSERKSIWRLTEGRWQIVFHKGRNI